MAAPQTTPAGDARPLFRDGPYLRWLTGDTAEALGNGLSKFAVPIVAATLTGSASDAGLIGAASGVGALAGLIPGGLLADRYDRKRLRAVSAGVGVVLSGLLTALLWSGSLTGLVLAALGFLLQLRGSLLGPASEAILRTVVGKTRIARAVVANQARDAAVGIVSGPLGGVLYAVASVLPFAAQTTAFVVEFVTNAGLRGDHRPAAPIPVAPPAAERPSQTRRTPHWLAELLRGFAVLRANPSLIGGTIAFAILNFAMNAMILTLILNQQFTGASPQRIGLISLDVGVGGLLGALLANPVIKRFRTGAIIVVGMVAFTASMAGVAAAPGFVIALVFVGTLLLTGPSINASLFGLLMHAVPNDVLGRVMAAVNLTTMALIPLSSAAAGFGLDRLGYRPTLIALALLTAVATLIAVAVRDLRRLPHSDHWGDVTFVIPE